MKYSFYEVYKPFVPDVVPGMVNKIRHRPYHLSLHNISTNTSVI